MKIVAGGQEEADDDAASPVDSPPTYLPKPLAILKTPLTPAASAEESDPAD